MKISSLKTGSSRRLAPFALTAVLIAGGSLNNLANSQSANNHLRSITQKRIQTLVKSAGNGVQNLHLTAAQKAKMASIAQKNRPLIQAIWNDPKLPKSVKISRVRALEKETRAVLTPAQKQQLMEAKREAMGQVFETALWISNELNLTSDQQNQLRNIVLANYRKASGDNFGTLRGLLVDTSSQIDNVLTPKQQTKWAVIKTTARQELVKQTRMWRQLNKV